MAVKVENCDAHTFGGEEEIAAKTERTDTRRNRAVTVCELEKGNEKASKKGGKGYRWCRQLSPVAVIEN